MNRITEGSAKNGPVSITGDYYFASISFDERQSKNTELHRWLRIVHYARANMPLNGWTVEQTPAELAAVVGGSTKNLNGAVGTAIKYGYLLKESTPSRLLLPPRDLHRKGKYGRPKAQR